MCHHHRSHYGYGYGYNRRCLHHRRQGPISALLALAVPLLTQNSEKQVLEPSQQPYSEPPMTTTRLAPQTSGRTTAPPGQPRPVRNPTNDLPNGPPPAYEHKSPNDAYASDGLEKSLANLSINEPAALCSTAATPTSNVPGAREYQPTTREMSTINNNNSNNSMIRTNNVPSSGTFDPSSRWAARLQRKEDKARAKLVRKVERFTRRGGRWQERSARREGEGVW